MATQRFSKVAPMRFNPEETEEMACLNTLWVQTLDTHEDVLAYPENIMLESFDDLCSGKLIDRNEFNPYEAENGSHWLVSQAIHLEDLDAFFSSYMEMEEEMAA